MRVRDIYWVGEDGPPRLAIVARPRGGEELAGDLAAFQAAGVDILISLLPEDEAWDLGLENEGRIAESLGMQFLAWPVPDRNTPRDPAAFRNFITQLAARVREGKRVGAHCRGCIGRSTVLIASVMVALGYEAQDALNRIEEARGAEVPDTLEQRAWILNLKPLNFNPLK